LKVSKADDDDDDDGIFDCNHAMFSKIMIDGLLKYLPEQDYDEGRKKCQGIEEEIDKIDGDVALDLLKTLYENDIESLEKDMAKIALLGTVNIVGVNRAWILGYLWGNILQPYFENESSFLKKAEPFINGRYPVVHF